MDFLVHMKITRVLDDFHPQISWTVQFIFSYIYGTVKWVIHFSILSPVYILYLP